MAERVLTGFRWMAVAACVGSLAACASAQTAATTTSTTPPGLKTLTILVTNDDGVGAPGINAVVQGLRALPHTQVTVVAPLTNQSGTGEKTTPTSVGPLV